MSEEQDEVPICEYCEISEADGVTYTNQAICSGCAMDCDNCGDVSYADDDWYLVDGDRWCSGCADSAYYCDYCNEWSADMTNTIYDTQESWCDNCASGWATWCDNCDHFTADGCDSCDTDESDYEGNRVIHDYNYRPDAVFHTTKSDERLFFGFELEMELNDRRDAAIFAAEQLEPNELAYLKNDGSLDNGFELVTHPMSFDFLMDADNSPELWDTIEKLRVYHNARSYNTRTCGFHIHISRTGFNGGAHMHRFLNLVYSNEYLFTKLAGRKSDQWAKFDDVQQVRNERVHDEDGIFMGFRTINLGKTFKNKLFVDNRYGGSVANDTDRYSAVNTRNRNTLEMRIFKGTMDRDALKSHIQLAHASVEYTRTLSIQQVKDGALLSNAFVNYVLDNEATYPELVSRMKHKNLLSTPEPVAV